MIEADQMRSQRLPEGVRFYLPRRDLGPARWAGMVPVVFGLFFAGFACFWIWGASGTLVDSSGNFQWLGLVFPLFGIPFVLVGMKVISIGLLIIAGRSEVDLQRGWLRVVEKAGPFRMQQKVALQEIEQLSVINPEQMESTPAALKKMMGASRLKIMRTGKPALEVLRGHPLPVIQELVDRVTSHWSEFSSGAMPLPKPEVRQESEVLKVADGEAAQFPSMTRRLEAPRGTKILKEEQGGQLIFTVPPAGYLGASKGLMIFGVLWSLCILLFTVAAIFGTANKLGEMLGALAFLSIFWAVGLALVLGATNMARRRAMILATANELKVAEKTLFKSRSYQWSKGQLKAVTVGPSGMVVNNRAIPNFQVVNQSGETKGFFTGRPVEELEWMATHLAEKLRLEESMVAANPAEGE